MHTVPSLLSTQEVMLFSTRAGSAANRDITLEPNPYAWSKVATMIYVDSPAGTGLSYSSSNQPTDDEQTTDDLVDFITQLLLDVFPHLLGNDLYIAGER
jgi:serine carboxypeptidase-like clade I